MVRVGYRGPRAFDLNVPAGAPVHVHFGPFAPGDHIDRMMIWMHRLLIAGNAYCGLSVHPQKPAATAAGFLGGRQLVSGITTIVSGVPMFRIPLGTDGMLASQLYMEVGVNYTMDLVERWFCAVFDTDAMDSAFGGCSILMSPPIRAEICGQVGGQ